VKNTKKRHIVSERAAGRYTPRQCRVPRHHAQHDQKRAPSGKKKAIRGDWKGLVRQARFFVVVIQAKIEGALTSVPNYMGDKRKGEKISE